MRNFVTELLLAVTIMFCVQAATTTPCATDGPAPATVDWTTTTDTDVTVQVTAAVDYGDARYLIVEDGSLSRVWSAHSNLDPTEQRFVASVGDRITVRAVYTDDGQTELVGEWRVSQDGLESLTENNNNSGGFVDEAE